MVALFGAIVGNRDRGAIGGNRRSFVIFIGWRSGIFWFYNIANFHLILGPGIWKSPKALLEAKALGSQPNHIDCWRAVIQYQFPTPSVSLSLSSSIFNYVISSGGGIQIMTPHWIMVMWYYWHCTRSLTGSLLVVITTLSAGIVSAIANCPCFPFLEFLLGLGCLFIQAVGELIFCLFNATALFNIEAIDGCLGGVKWICIGTWQLVGLKSIYIGGGSLGAFAPSIPQLPNLLHLPMEHTYGEFSP